MIAEVIIHFSFDPFSLFIIHYSFFFFFLKNTFLLLQIEEIEAQEEVVDEAEVETEDQVGLTETEIEIEEEIEILTEEIEIGIVL